MTAATDAKIDAKIDAIAGAATEPTKPSHVGGGAPPGSHTPGAPSPASSLSGAASIRHGWL
jgi:hypothetical protein